MLARNLIVLAVSSALLVSMVAGGSAYMNSYEKDRINKAQSSWKASIPTDLSNKTAADLRGMVSHFPPAHEAPLGNAPEDEPSLKRLLQTIPASFDARTKWPSCIAAIRNQGSSCGSCWAFSSSSVFQDRLCITGKVSPPVVRSPQFLIDCDWNEAGCGGGNVNKAWSFLVTYGAPTEACKAYKGVQNKCVMKCDDNSTLYTPKAAGVKTYTSVAAMQADLMANGPIVTWYSVFNDFYYYKSGIYVPTSTNLLGYHAVKVVGWGTDANLGLYWIIANSWGATWGENGYFRIKAGVAGIDDVSHFVAGTF